MRITDKPWLIGLLQAFSVFCFTILLYFSFPNILRFSSFPYRTVAPLIAITVIVTAFIFAVIIYILVVFAYPVILFSNKKVIEAVKTVIFTAVFLLMFLLLIVMCIYLFADRDSLTNRENNIPNPVIYMSREDALRKAKEVRIKSENARIDYEYQQNNNVAPTKVITITPESKMYPYVIDVDTGEKTPINP